MLMSLAGNVSTLDPSEKNRRMQPQALVDSTQRFTKVDRCKYA
jgi:hypothetical protein